MSSITAEQVQNAVISESVIRGCRTLPKGHLAIETVFTYPDGGSIEVYLPKESLFDSHQDLSITDFGNTVNWLTNLGIKAWQGPSKRELVRQAVDPYCVEARGAELRIEGLPLGALHDGIVRLAQACLRVADTCYTKRFRPTSDFQARVEDVFGELEFSYESAYEIPVDGRKIKVDALIQGRTKRSAILLMSTANESYAKIKSQDVFAKWYDLRKAKRPEQRVTIWDESNNVYRDQDIERLADVSSVLTVDQRDDLMLLVAA